MLRTLLTAILLSLSLCADCFAVALCSSVTIDMLNVRRRVWKVALVFTLVHVGFLLSGWGVGRLFTGWISRLVEMERAAGVVAFLLLAWVGGSMVLEAWRDNDTRLDLRGFWPIVLGAVATSIDAFAVGLSLALSRTLWTDIALTAAVLALCTVLSVVAGMCSGSAIGTRFGRPARFAGGIILLCLGVSMLF